MQRFEKPFAIKKGCDQVIEKSHLICRP